MAAAAILVILPDHVSADEPPVEPTPLEAFAARPSVEIAFEEKVGSIEGSDAKLEVAALILNDAANPPESMRGARFALENNTGQDQAYLDEAQLGALKNELTGIQEGIPKLKTSDSAPYRVQGTGSCWRPPRRVRIMCPSYRVGPDGSGLGLGTFGGWGFSFPGHKPSEVSELIDKAMAALAAH